MAIYVDNVEIAANITDVATGRSYHSRWCHLFSSEIDQAELHEFAQRIGLRHEWFQPGKDLLDRSLHDPVGDHYDVTAGKRKQAIAAGAVSVNLHRASELWSAKRVRHVTAKSERVDG